MLRWQMERRNDGPKDLICMGVISRWKYSFVPEFLYSISVFSSVPYDISASLRTNPDLMQLFSIDIDSRARTKGFLLRLLIFGVRDCQVPLRD
jgi:hypothetical protein